MHSHIYMHMWVYEYMFTCILLNISIIQLHLYYLTKILSLMENVKKSIDYSLPSKVSMHIYSEIEIFLLFLKLYSFLKQYILIIVSLPPLLPAFAHLPSPPVTLPSCFPFQKNRFLRDKN